MKHSIRQAEVFHDAPPEATPLPPATMAFLLSRTSMLKEAWELVQAVTDWPGVEIAHDPTGLCLALDGVTLGHLRWNGRIDLPFGPVIRDRLVAEAMASRDPEHPNVDRVVFDVRSAADVNRAVWLLRLAYLSMEPKVDVCATDVARSPFAIGLPDAP